MNNLPKAQKIFGYWLVKSSNTLFANLIVLDAQQIVCTHAQLIAGIRQFYNGWSTVFIAKWNMLFPFHNRTLAILVFIYDSSLRIWRTTCGTMHHILLKKIYFFYRFGPLKTTYPKGVYCHPRLLYLLGVKQT